jgi:hypothetical protein
MTPNTKAHASHLLAAGILLLFGLLSLILTIVCSFTPYPGVAMISGIFALILGKLSFDSFESAAKLEPPPAPPPEETFLHRLDLFSALLKTGQEVHVILQVQYERATDERATLARIQAELQRIFNSYLLGVEKLSDDPFTEIDFIVNTSVVPLARKLGLQGLELKTIDVKLAGSVPPPPGSSYQGSVEQWKK